jgi:hypothetical protein
MFIYIIHHTKYKVNQLQIGAANNKTTANIKLIPKGLENIFSVCIYKKILDLARLQLANMQLPVAQNERNK